MTKQEAFTLMVQHLRTQAAPSFTTGKDGEVHCLYRHPDGIKRCAVGVLLSDADYRPTLENKGIGGVLAFYPHLRQLAPLNSTTCIYGYFGMLQQMQNLHDSVLDSQGNIKKDFLNLWEDGFKNIARDHDLIVPEHPCTDKVTVEVAMTQAEPITV